jgi:hypothetical protein
MFFPSIQPSRPRASIISPSMWGKDPPGLR